MCTSVHVTRIHAHAHAHATIPHTHTSTQRQAFHPQLIRKHSLRNQHYQFHICHPQPSSLPASLPSTPSSRPFLSCPFTCHSRPQKSAGILQWVCRKMCVCVCVCACVYSQVHVFMRCNEGDGSNTSTTHCTATHCNTLQHTATHCNTLQQTATHCNTWKQGIHKDSTRDTRNRALPYDTHTYTNSDNQILK